MQHHITSLQHFFTQSINFYKGTHIGREALHAKWNDIYVAIGVMSLVSVIGLVISDPAMVSTYALAGLAATLVGWFALVYASAYILNQHKKEHHVTTREVANVLVVSGFGLSIATGIADIVSALAPGLAGLIGLLSLAAALYVLYLTVVWVEKLFGVTRTQAVYAVIGGAIACAVVSGVIMAAIAGGRRGW